MKNYPKVHLLKDPEKYISDLYSGKPSVIAQTLCEEARREDRVTNHIAFVACEKCLNKAHEDFGKERLILTTNFADQIGDELSVKNMGIHSALPDWWNKKCVVWVIKGNSLAQIYNLKYAIRQAITKIIYNVELLGFSIE